MSLPARRRYRGSLSCEKFVKQFGYGGFFFAIYSDMIIRTIIKSSRIGEAFPRH